MYEGVITRIMHKGLIGRFQSCHRDEAYQSLIGCFAGLLPFSTYCYQAKRTNQKGVKRYLDDNFDSWPYFKVDAIFNCTPKFSKNNNAM